MDKTDEKTPTWDRSEVSYSLNLLLSSTITHFLTLFEDELFLSLFDKHGKKWVNLADEYNRLTKTSRTYSGDQCMSHYRVFDPDLEKGKWSPKV
jgi:hypothetical protein